MLHKLALGIMAQPGACKHTHKIMLSGRPSRMMSGGPSVRMSRCLSMMISRCLSVMKSGSPLVMVFGGPSMRMFGRLSVMMSGGPSMRMFGSPSMRMSESSSVMMFGRLAVMMSGGPSMRMFGRLSMMMSGSPSMMMFGSLSMMMSGSPSMMMFGSPSMRMPGCLLAMMLGNPSMRMPGCLLVMMSGSPSIRMFGRLSGKFFGQPSIKSSERSSEKKSVRSSKKISERFSKKISGQSSKKISGQSSKKISERFSKKISERFSKKISERFSKKISGQSSKKISERFSKKISGRSPIKVSEQFSKKISGRLLEKISERPSEKISGHNNEEFQEQKPDSEGYTGLENQGATCYLNTVLQILFMTEEFREAVEGYKPHNCNLNNHIAQLFKHLKSGDRNTATTEGITTELKINVHKQEDAAKCLQKILNKVNPEISKIFQGTMVDKTICKTPTKHHEPLTQVKTFFIISISLESQDHINMQSCFESYFAPIIMSGEDQQIYCKDCEMMMDTEIICSLRSVPSVLVLHLERFELDFDTMCCVKNHSSVEIPPQLLVKDEDGVNHTYDLYAIANHVGSLSGGHYYADIRSFEDQQWYQFDDSSVRQMCDLMCDLDKPLLSDEAYLLLYKKSAVVSTASQSETAEDEPNKMDEGTSSKCENPEKDEIITDIKADLESHFNSSLSEQQEESTNTSACDGCLTTDHHHPSSLSEDSDHDSETNASTQQTVSDEESKSLMGTNDVLN